MKLKKIVSLALAGLMAVSMLAACGDNSSSNSSSSEAPVATGLTGKVIAALDKDVTDMVTFTGSDSAMQKVLDALAADAATSNSAFKTAITNTKMIALNPTLGAVKLTNTQITNTTSNGSDSKTETAIYVVYATGTNEDLVAESLAYEIANATVYDSSAKIAGLPENSLPDANKDYQFNFDYTGSMAVVSAKDSTTGEVTYALAFSITRTPTKVEYKNV